jgi:hypothetical protein
MRNINIFMLIPPDFLPISPITYASGYYKNDCYISDLAASGYIELGEANLLSFEQDNK